MKSLYTKYRLLNTRVKAAAWFTMCSFLQKGISFITVPIFTRLMPPEQYGIYSLYVSWLQLFTVISTLYLYHGVTDNAMAKFDEDRDSFLSSMQGLTITVTTCVMLILFAFLHDVPKVMGLAPVMMVLMFIEIYLVPALSFWSAHQRFEYRYKRLVGITILKSILNPCFGLMAVYFSEEKALARVFSTVFVEFIICAPIMIYQFAKGRRFFSKMYWKYALVLAIPMLPHYLSGIILLHGDRIMISKLIGTAEVALYSVAYNIGMIAQLFVNAINNAITPWVYGKLKISDIGSIKERFRLIMLFVFFISLMLMLVSPELICIFGSSDYADARYVIPPVAGSVFFIFLYGILSFPEFYYEKTSFLMISSLVSAGLNIILNYFFIPKFGFIAAAYTTLTCYVIYSTGHYIVGSVILNRETKERSIINPVITIVLSLLIIMASFVMRILFPYMVLRYCLIAVCFVVAIIRRKDIARILEYH